jgi:serine/threonine protein phosphatase PrpC
MVVCPYCQQESADPLFCDRCHGLLRVAPLSSGLPARISLADGREVDCSAWQGTWPSDCWQPIVTTCGETPCRVYALDTGTWQDMAPAVHERAGTALDVLAPVEVVPIEGGAVVVAAGLEDACLPLLDVAEGDEMACLEGTLAACRTLAAALESLHHAGLVWLNFAPDALQTGERGICLANLDLQLFRAGSCPHTLLLSPAYSPPEVCSFRGDRIGPATDVFHASLYLYYRLAGLLPGGFPGRGLEAFDFDIPPLRIYRPHLPVGIIPILERGLARDPGQRFGSIAEFLTELTAAVERARRRAGGVNPLSRQAQDEQGVNTPRSPGAVSWTCGGASAIGRSHEILNQSNQDAHLVLPLLENRLVAVVADGVTHARIGAGDIASMTAVEVLAARLPDLLEHARTPGDFEEALAEGCLQASQAIIDLARTVVPPEGCDPVDVMSTTVVAGVVADGVLTLASAGDSRAYLIAAGHVEQLTVDGDVRCAHLAGGMPPEVIRELGVEAGALYSCLGVAEANDSGSLEVSVARSRPKVGHWRLLPGDIVVLCSDGVVEEGLFLSAAELPVLLAEAAGQSAAKMAQRLVRAACDRHRQPSLWEPAGCGDDATCVVVVVG